MLIGASNIPAPSVSQHRLDTVRELAATRPQSGSRRHSMNVQGMISELQALAGRWNTNGSDKAQIRSQALAVARRLELALGGIGFVSIDPQRGGIVRIETGAGVADAVTVRFAAAAATDAEALTAPEASELTQHTAAQLASSPAAAQSLHTPSEDRTRYALLLQSSE